MLVLALSMSMPLPLAAVFVLENKTAAQSATLWTVRTRIVLSSSPVRQVVGGFCGGAMPTDARTVTWREETLGLLECHALTYTQKTRSNFDRFTVLFRKKRKKIVELFLIALL